MSVSTIVQEALVDNVGSTVISAITQDPNTNLFLRTITVNAPPDSNGNVAVQFTLHISGATQSAVELSSPTAIQVTAPSGNI